MKKFVKSKISIQVKIYTTEVSPEYVKTPRGFLMLCGGIKGEPGLKWVKEKLIMVYL